jgi:steroid 5-alpha reductase family enzyme
MTAIFISFILITTVNVIAYIWAYKNQSDHLTDISYSACFIAAVSYFLLFEGSLSMGRVILSLMVILWGLRLGGFLFYRIHNMGRDIRFDAFRDSKSGFLNFWLLQSISIWIIALPAMIGLTKEWNEINLPALILWIIGMTIESIADWQKFSFRSKHQPIGAFIDYGLYKYIRHPNYLGEILVWVSIFWFVTPYLNSLEWLTIISPIWVIALLLWISGIPLIELTNVEKYKGNTKFEAYVKRTYRLIPGIY